MNTGFPGANGASSSAGESLFCTTDLPKTTPQLAVSAWKSGCKGCWGDRTQKQLARAKFGEDQWHRTAAPPWNSNSKRGIKHHWIQTTGCSLESLIHGGE